MTIRQAIGDTKIKLTGNNAKSMGISVMFVFTLLLFSFILLGIYTKVTSKIVLLLFEIVFFLCIIPTMFGLYSSLLNLLRGNDTKILDLYKNGIEYFKPVWKVTGRLFLKSIIPIITLVAAITALGYSVALTNNNPQAAGVPFVASIALALFTIFYFVVLTLKYSFAFFVLYDDKELSGKEALVKSKDLAKGNKGLIFMVIFLWVFVLYTIRYFINLFSLTGASIFNILYIILFLPSLICILGTIYEESKQ